MKVALVTGASRGLGVAMAQALASDGWDVAVNYAHDEAGAQRTVAAIVAAGGIAKAFRFDVTDPEAIQEGLRALEDTLGPVDLVVNNATGPQPTLPIQQQTWEAYLQQLNFFVKAPVLLLQALLPGWRARKSGRIINIGSELAEYGGQFISPYATGKSAISGLTRSWARELGPDNITVNLVAPGWTPLQRYDASTPNEFVQNYIASIPLGRQGRPEELADVICFLASPKANFITGQTICVNGGRTIA
jgi:3-oxoacyl-[acyl-carrier protein] reductase